MGSALSRAVHGFVRENYPPSSRSRAVLSAITRMSDQQGDNPLALNRDAKTLSFLDNEKLSQEIFERSKPDIGSTASPFFVTPFAFQDIMTTTNMRRSINEELLKTLLLSIKYGSRSPSKAIDDLARRMTPQADLSAPPSSTIACGDKKCCAVKDSFEICNCDPDIVEISQVKSEESSGWRRIPRCASRYERVESIFAGDGSRIKVAENLEGMSRLKTLDLNGSDIETLDGIDGLPSLERLFLKNSSVRDVKSIDRLQSLRSLDIRSKYARDIMPVKRLKNLKHLVVNWGNLNDESVEMAKDLMSKGIHVNLA